MATFTVDANHLDGKPAMTIADGGVLGAKSVRVIIDDTVDRHQIADILARIRQLILENTQYPPDLGIS